jgi:hypothetical protein
MPQPSNDFSQKRLRRSAWLRAEIELERERLRALLEHTQTVLDRLSIEPAVGKPSSSDEIAGDRSGC